MKNVYFATLLAAILVLSACGWTKQDLGLEHRGPNASNVKVNNPLILPPEYNVRPNAIPYPEESETTEE